MIARWSRSICVGLAWVLTTCALLGPACRERAPADRSKPAVAKRPAKPAVCLLQRPATSPLAPPALALDAPGFSVANSRAWLKVVIHPGLRGRKAGTVASLRLARLLAAQLARFGLKPGLADGSFCQPFTAGGKPDQNVVARRSAQRENAPVVLVGAHYDGLGLEKGKPHAGADDNGSGVAAVLEVARLLGRGAAPGAEVIVVLFGAEELGLLGSKHYVKQAGSRLQRLRLMINLDMVGRQLLEGQPVRALLGDPKDTLGYVLSDRGHRWTGPMLRQVTRRQKLSVVGIPESFLKLAGFLSDSVPFSPRVPTVFLSTSLHDDYGKLSDTADKIDHRQVRRAARLVLGLIRAVARAPAPGPGPSRRTTPSPPGRR